MKAFSLLIDELITKIFNESVFKLISFQIKKKNWKNFKRSKIYIILFFIIKLS